MRDSKLCVWYTVEIMCTCILASPGREHTLFTMFLLHIDVDLGHNIRRHFTKLVFRQRFHEKITYIPFSFNMSYE